MLPLPVSFRIPMARFGRDAMALGLLPLRTWLWSSP
jgi:hypothetical protein